MKIRQGAPIVEYDPLVKIDWETMTGALTAPQDQAEKELSRLRKRMSTDKINVTVTNESSRENPIFDLKGILSLPDLLPGALKIAYLTAFKTLGDAFLDDALNPQWQGVIRATTMAELIIAYVVLGTGKSQKFLPFMISSDPWKGALPKLTETEHRVVIQNQGDSGVRATVELLGGGLRIQARACRSGDFCLAPSRARIIVCDAKESKVRFEDLSFLGAA